MIIRILILLLFLAPPIVYARGEKEQPPLIGNFMLPPSQQPGPMIGFGQNILNQNEIQFYLFTADFRGPGRNNLDLTPSFLYGITDNLSLMVSAPIAADYQSYDENSSGFGDAFVQLEYAFYNKVTARFSDQATFVANVTFPSGSITANPSTGYGSPSIFLGTTLARMMVDWFAYTAYGATLTTINDGNRIGNSYSYQFGLGRNIATTDQWIFAFQVEADGLYSEQNQMHGITDPNSGGNAVLVTPSFWMSSKNLVIQLGMGVPVTQHFYGQQPGVNYLLALNLGWSIY